MTVFKCKMCGGALEVKEGMTVCECEYCGSTQTVPQLDDEKKINLFSRANRLRSACEFDKASGIYEAIIADFPEEAEAYWGLILCRFGIEYVDDPRTGKKIPTCHRSSFESIMDDQDFEMVMEYSDPTSRTVYRNEAKAIEKLRIGINEVSSKEAPYDIFICYKETDAMGERTLDSVIAQDVYDALVEKGYRVFFSRITLEDKLGEEYEPYIFAALNSSKVMLVFGTDYEYFNAVWVKNEWSRFLALIEKGEKKTLIPCYKGIDAYDMPKEFARLQAQDMGKVGSIQDLLRGIEKILGARTGTNSNLISLSTVATNSAIASIESLLKRAFVFLEDKNWDSANEYAERVLDIDPENGQAYLVKLLADLQVSSEADLIYLTSVFEDNDNYQKVCRYDKSTFETIKKYNDTISVSIKLCDDVKRNNISAIERDLSSGANANYAAVSKKRHDKTPVLILAIANGSVEAVKLLLSKGADPNCERVLHDGSRYSALRDSLFEWPNEIITDILIDTGADVNYAERHDNAKIPLLINSIAKSNIEMVKLLLSKGANPNCERVFRDGSRYSALRDSLFEWPNEGIADILMAAGADVNCIEQHKNSRIPLLINTIAKGNVERVKLLLSKGADPNCERVFHDGSHYSALRDSLFEWPNDEIARLLIDAGADINYVEHNKKDSIPMLINAIVNSDVRLVKLLLSKGANPNSERISEDGTHDSALSICIMKRPNDEIARMLIDAGADINYVEQNNSARIPVLINAIAKSNVEMVKLLLSKGANPNCERIFRDGRRYSALRDSIVQWPNDEITRLLIGAGADINYVEQNSNAKVPLLSIAIADSNIEMVKLLLSKGADPNCERVAHDGQSYRALSDSMIEWPNDEITRLLINAGADVNEYIKVDNSSMSILNYAIIKSNVELVKLLLSKGADPNSERILPDGAHHSALRDSIVLWPNNIIVELLCSSGARIEPAKNSFLFSSKEHLSKETIQKLKGAGYRFKLFG